MYVHRRALPSTCRAVACQLPSRLAREFRRTDICVDVPGLPDPARPAPEPRADRELVQRILRGDAASTEHFVERMRCIPRILAVIDRHRGRRLDDHELADLAQETVVVLWRKLATFTDEGTLETWAFGVARLEYQNVWRRKLRQLDRTEPLDPDRTPAAPIPAGGRLAQDELDGWLAELPPEEARILRGKHLEERTFQELAGELGLSSNTVKTSYYRALRNLQQKLARRLREEGEGT